MWRKEIDGNMQKYCCKVSYFTAHAQAPIYPLHIQSNHPQSMWITMWIITIGNNPRRTVNCLYRITCFTDKTIWQILIVLASLSNALIYIYVEKS